MTSTPLHLLSVFYGPECCVSWSMFQVSLKKRWLMLLMENVAYWCLLYSVDWRCCWVQLCLNWFFLYQASAFLRAAEASDSGGENPYHSSQSCRRMPQAVGRLLSTAYTERAVLSSWRAGSFIVKQRPLYLPTVQSFKFALSEVNVVNPASLD